MSVPFFLHAKNRSSIDDICALTDINGTLTVTGSGSGPTGASKKHSSARGRHAPAAMSFAVAVAIMGASVL
jgi:hypothetical protein